MSTPETLIQEIDRLMEGITPVGDEHTKLARYDHGGGRLYREVESKRQVYAGATDRTLIADFYNEGDREFYVAAPRLLRAAKAEILRLERISGEVIEALRIADCWCDTGDGNPHSPACLRVQRVVAEAAPEGNRAAQPTGEGAA